MDNIVKFPKAGKTTAPETGARYFHYFHKWSDWKVVLAYNTYNEKGYVTGIAVLQEKQCIICKKVKVAIQKSYTIKGK